MVWTLRCRYLLKKTGYDFFGESLGSVVKSYRTGLIKRLDAQNFSTCLHRMTTYTSSGSETSKGLLGKRPKKTKFKSSVNGQKLDTLYDVTAYATAEEYNLQALFAAVVEQGLYEQIKLPSDVDDAILLTAKYLNNTEPRDIVVFEQGSVVFWNFQTDEQDAFMNLVQNFEEESYEKSLYLHESEKMVYSYFDEEPKVRTRIRNDTMMFGSNSDEDTKLEKFVFSNGLMLSVKLAIWEARLAEYIESIADVTESLRTGDKLKVTRQDVIKKTGELFTLSHSINLSSDLIDTPDFYWDRDVLERQYKQSLLYFNIPHRTKVMNHKLSHCIDLLDLLRDHLNTNHEVRLEWMIILLIIVEVAFEIAHTVERHWNST